MTQSATTTERHVRAVVTLAGAEWIPGALQLLQAIACNAGVFVNSLDDGCVAMTVDGITPAALEGWLGAMKADPELADGLLEVTESRQ